MTPTVTVHHPDVADLAPAADLFTAVTGGRWSALAVLCADELTDPDRTAAELDALAGQSGWTFTAAPVAVVLDEAAGTLQLPADLALTVLDLFTRVRCGQWREASNLAVFYTEPTGRRRPTMYDQLPDGRFLPDALDQLRVAGQRPDSSWPPHPRASTGIAEGPPAARLAYHVFKQLGGGTPGAPTFALATPVRLTGAVPTTPAERPLW